MRLLEVNGTSLLGATHQEAVNILRCSGNTITLVVCKGYDKNDLEQALYMSGGRDSKESRTSREYRDSTTDEVKSLSQSVSSLDRDDEDTATIRQEQEMKAELVAWELEERERALAEYREKSTPEKVLLFCFFIITLRNFYQIIIIRIKKSMFNIFLLLNYQSCFHCLRTGIIIELISPLIGLGCRTSGRVFGKQTKQPGRYARTSKVSWWYKGPKNNNHRYE